MIAAQTPSPPTASIVSGKMQAMGTESLSEHWRCRRSELAHDAGRKTFGFVSESMAAELERALDNAERASHEAKQVPVLREALDKANARIAELLALQDEAAASAAAGTHAVYRLCW